MRSYEIPTPVEVNTFLRRVFVTNNMSWCDEKR
jgi:hypothetical protein